MRPSRYVVFFSSISLALLFAGCGDEKKDPQKDGGADRGADVGIDKGKKDVKTTDGKKPDGALASNLGEGCITAKGCKAGSPVCMMYSNIFTWIQPAGICTRTCTVNDPKTPLVNEDNCPKGHSCTKFGFSTATVYYCLKDCTPSLTKNPCPASSGQTCHPLSARFTGSAEKAVCIYPACKTKKDCPAFSDTSCISDKDCTKVGTDAFCEPSSQTCARPGSCSKAGLCGPHGYGTAKAKVGDPCKTDFDCPINGVCLKEDQSTFGSIGVSYRNGYCVTPYCAFSNYLSAYSCPVGSTCNWLYSGGLCFKTCKLADKNGCRHNAKDKGGDYECYAWNNWKFTSGSKVTAEPVCMNAPTQTCDSLPTGNDCRDLGDANNPTHMECRDRNTGLAKVKPLDPTGVCLDDTASGLFHPAAADAGPEAGAVDAGVPDAGVDGGSDPEAGPAVDTGVASQ